MEMIPLPTDSLYKFVALSGLAIVTGSLVFCGRAIFALRERLHSIVRAAARMKVQERHLERDIAQAPQGSSEDLLRRQDELEVLRAELGEDAAYASRLWRDIVVLYVLTVLAGILGGGMARWGFTQWARHSAAEELPAQSGASLDTVITRR